jgi:hypothetical protein
MGKKRLLILLGAGSSVECGMPSVAAIDALMPSWAREVAEKNKWGADWYGPVRDALAARLDQGFEQERTKPNFEQVLGELVTLMHWEHPPPGGVALREFIRDADVSQELGLPSNGPYDATIAVKMLVCGLLDRLANHVRDICRQSPPNTSGRAQWRSILNMLRERFDVALYTLNYDTLATEAWPDAFIGFQAGVFDAHKVLKRSWGTGITHLHGSVHLSLKQRHGSEDIVWRRSLDDHFDYSDDGTSADQVSNGKVVPRTTLVAGGYKLDQLLVEPFHSYQAAFVRDVYAAESIFIAGYGFGDAHVNRALRNALRREGMRPRVLVADKAGGDTPPVSYRHDHWGRWSKNTLAADGPFRMPLQDVPPVMPYLLAEKDGCEWEEVHQIAIWYGGFLRLLNAIDRLGDWLDGGSENLLERGFES